MSKFQKLVHKFKRYKLPLNVEGQAHLIDPSIKPCTTVSHIERTGLELKLQKRVILREEQILARVIESFVVKLRVLC